MTSPYFIDLILFSISKILKNNYESKENDRKQTRKELCPRSAQQIEQLAQWGKVLLNEVKDDSHLQKENELQKKAEDINQEIKALKLQIKELVKQKRQLQKTTRDSIARAKQKDAQKANALLDERLAKQSQLEEQIQQPGWSNCLVKLYRDELYKVLDNDKNLSDQQREEIKSLLLNCMSNGR